MLIFILHEAISIILPSEFNDLGLGSTFQLASGGNAYLIEPSSLGQNKINMEASIGGLLYQSFAEKVIIQIPHPTNYGRIVEIEITQFDLQGISVGLYC